MKKKYDYLIVGAGLFGATCAYELTKAGFSVLVIEKRDHIGGNVFTKNDHGINVHVYGPHIFHTDNKVIWDYVNQFSKFNDFVNSPLANYHGEIYHLPFSMNTFCELWPDVKTSEDAKKHIEEEKQKFNITEPKNLEEQAISLVGETIFRKLIKEYTEKQWGKSCRELPPSIIKRIPVRFTFDNNYFTDPYQGIPIGGYTAIIGKMLAKSDVLLNTDFLKEKDKYLSIAKKIIYTGMIDEFFDYKFGSLDYRSLRFETEFLDIPSYQGNAVVNYTSHEKPFTRIVEHKFFEFGQQPCTIISREYPDKFEQGKIPYYTINDEKNNFLLKKYQAEAQKYHNIYFGGRLGSYRYYDMDDVIMEALALTKELING